MYSVRACGSAPGVSGTDAAGRTTYNSHATLQSDRTLDQLSGLLAGGLGVQSCMSMHGVGDDAPLVRALIPAPGISKAMVARTVGTGCQHRGRQRVPGFRREVTPSVPHR